MLIGEIKKLIDGILFPQICLVCRSYIDTRNKICIDCWQKLEFISYPKCTKCSRSFMHQMEIYLECNCSMKFHSYSEVMSLVHYNNTARAMILGLKDNKKLYFARFIGTLLYIQFKEQIEHFDIICPVPLSFRKMRLRSFNQAALIAKYIAKFSRKKLINNLLLKVRDTKAQVELKQNERIYNLQNAFVFNNRFKVKAKEQKVLIVDDVITTGSTAQACSQVLLNNGIAKVALITFAKTSLEN